jgi:hypothetical protein
MERAVPDQEPGRRTSEASVREVWQLGKRAKGKVATALNISVFSTNYGIASYNLSFY